MDPDEQNDKLQGPPEPEPGPDPDPDFYARALRRIPRWIALAAALALPFAWWRGGPVWAASFLTGAIAGYWNFVLVCRIADRLSQAPRSTARSSIRSLLRLLFIAAAAFVIIRFTHINMAAAFLGFLTPVAAVVMEILFELATRQS